MASGHMHAGGVLQLTTQLLKMMAPNVKDKSKIVYSLTPVEYSRYVVKQTCHFR